MNLTYEGYKLLYPFLLCILWLISETKFNLMVLK